jgi:SAM-dependent methyltransferase
VSRPSNLLHKVLAAAYYRFGLGRGSRFERWARPRVRGWERRTARGDAPFDKAQWEEQFAGGRWDYLAAEEPRYRSLAALVARHRPAARVLDVGCGAGPLVPALRAAGISGYVGIDISEQAIAAAARFADGETRFAAVDGESFRTAEAFDAVIFNESLYYFEDPLAGVAHFARFLRPSSASEAGGSFFLSMFSSRRSLAILREVERRSQVLERRTVNGPRGAWHQVVLVPLAEESR